VKIKYLRSCASFPTSVKAEFGEMLALSFKLLSCYMLHCTFYDNGYSTPQPYLLFEDFGNKNKEIINFLVDFIFVLLCP